MECDIYIFQASVRFLLGEPMALFFGLGASVQLLGLYSACNRTSHCDIVFRVLVSVYYYFYILIL